MPCAFIEGNSEAQVDAGGAADLASAKQMLLAISTIEKNSMMMSSGGSTI